MKTTLGYSIVANPIGTQSLLNDLKLAFFASTSHFRLQLVSFAKAKVLGEHLPLEEKLSPGKTLPPGNHLQANQLQDVTSRNTASQGERSAGDSV